MADAKADSFRQSFRFLLIFLFRATDTPHDQTESQPRLPVRDLERDLNRPSPSVHAEVLVPLPTQGPRHPGCELEVGDRDGGFLASRPFLLAHVEEVPRFREEGQGPGVGSVALQQSKSYITYFANGF